MNKDTLKFYLNQRQYEDAIFYYCVENGKDSELTKTFIALLRMTNQTELAIHHILQDTNIMILSDEGDKLIKFL